jgi:hypothetical protein
MAYLILIMFTNTIPPELNVKYLFVKGK